MKRTGIDFPSFHEKVAPLMKATKCPLKKEIARQVFSLNKDTGWQQKLLKDALDLALTHPPEKDAPELLRSLQRGAGSKECAAALYYWMHSIPLYRVYAKNIDLVAFEGETFNQKFGFDVFTSHSEEEHSTTFDETIQSEIDKLRSRLDEACLAAQEYPSLILLLDEITTIFERKEVYYDGREGFFTVRSIMDQIPWFNLSTLKDFYNHKQKNTITQWRNRFGDFSEMIDNRRFVIVRPDGARISTDALHRMESWFVKLWLLLREGVIHEKNIELFIRYLLVFTQANRSDFMCYYFNDSEAKIRKVLSLGVERAKKTGLNIRDYKPVDRIYRDIYEIS